MLKYILLIPLLLLVGCTESSFKENAGITKYALEKYESELIKENVKILKCYPGKDDVMRAVYTVENRDNGFPATIRFDYLNSSYKVFFDVAYLNGSRDTLIKDIDSCIVSWKDLKAAQDTWK